MAVECARFGADVHAVERDPDDADRVRRNAVTHGVHVAVTTGSAPAALEGLPQPDAVVVPYLVLGGILCLVGALLMAKRFGDDA